MFLLTCKNLKWKGHLNSHNRQDFVEKLKAIIMSPFSTSFFLFVGNVKHFTVNNTNIAINQMMCANRYGEENGNCSTMRINFSSLQRCVMRKAVLGRPALEFLYNVAVCTWKNLYLLTDILMLQLQSRQNNNCTKVMSQELNKLHVISLYCRSSLSAAYFLSFLSLCFCSSIRISLLK